MRCIGNTYNHQGAYYKAIELYEQELAIAR